MEVEVRREQSEQDAKRAFEETERLRRDLGGKLSNAEKNVQQARQETSNLQATVNHLLNEKFNLEKEIKEWKEKVQHFEKEIDKWKRLAQRYEVDIREVQSQLSHKFKEKVFVLEQLKDAAEQRAEDWLAKYNEAETKCMDIDRRATEKLRLMEEQIKLKQAEIERRSEELQEKLKREAEIRAARKLEKILEERMQEYDLEHRAAADKRVRDAETALFSRLAELEKKASDAASNSEKRGHELEEKLRVRYLRKTNC